VLYIRDWLDAPCLKADNEGAKGEGAKAFYIPECHRPLILVGP